MADGVKYTFMCLCALCISSFEKCPFMSFAHFLSGVLFFFMLTIEISSHIVGTSPLSVMWLAHIFSHTVASFHPLQRVFPRPKLKPSFYQNSLLLLIH